MPAASTDREAIIAQTSAKRSVAARSVAAATVMTALKLVTGILTGSIGMLSEAAHSSVDLIASAITLFAVSESDKPADEDHTYGHGKLENLSAFIESLIMLISCLWIIEEAIRRIIFRHFELHLTPWPFAVLVLSIAVDFSRSRALRKVARSADSQALAADALHFGTDIWSSAAVLVGLIACWAGGHWHISWLNLADPIAALLVAGIILSVTGQLARETINVLLDAAPQQARRDLQRALSSIENVLTVDRVRLRRSGNRYFADLSLGLERNLTFQRTQQVVGDATAAVRNLLPDADVVVNTVPVASITESIFDRIRAVAARSNLSIHDVSVRNFDGRLAVEQHIEVNETLPLRDAHDLVTRIESEMLHDVPEISTILTHIESEQTTIDRAATETATTERDRDLEVRLRRVTSCFPDIIDVHDVHISRPRDLGSSRANDGLQISCHCTLPDNLPMSRVHEIITALEAAFMLDSPEVHHVLIHPEPATDNRR
jgi:cation diffusion facilitator family transporter